MATNLKPVDVAVIGLGAAGGVAVLPLARAGLKIAALEAGDVDSKQTHDEPPDQAPHHAGMPQSPSAILTALDVALEIGLRNRQEHFGLLGSGRQLFYLEPNVIPGKESDRHAGPRTLRRLPDFLLSAAHIGTQELDLAVDHHLGRIDILQAERTAVILLP